MDLLQDPKVKTTYDKCRYKVKLWEHEFQKNFNRPPSKLDIREASREVRNAYRTYFRLKTAALEESLNHIDGFDADTDKEDPIAATNHTIQPDKTTTVVDEPSSRKQFDLGTSVNTEATWGLHLNKPSSSTQKDRKIKAEKLNVNLSFSQKLFEGSKSSKRLPRKSLSFVRKKSESDAKPQFFSQPDYSTSFSDNLQETFESKINDNINNVLQMHTVKTVVPPPVVLSQPVNIVQNAVSNNYNHKPMRMLDLGWVQRVTQDTGTEISKDSCNVTKADYDSDDIIGNSEDEQDTSCSLYHVVKKRKTTANVTIVQEETSQLDTQLKSKNSLITVDTTPKRLDFSNIFNHKDTNKNDNCPTESKEPEKNDKAVKQPVNIYDFEPEVELKQNKKKSGNFKTKLAKSVNLNENTRKSGRARKTIVDVSQSDTENEDPYYSDNDVNDPEFCLETSTNNLHFLNDISDSNQTSSTQNTSKKSRSNQNGDLKQKLKKSAENKVVDLSPETEDGSHTYELEYSVKPRVVTVPRVKNIKQAVSKKKILKSAPQNDVASKSGSTNRAAQKLQQKVESGTLNDNYVQINLKKKIYVRGKSNKTFSKYKKQMWKSKKKALYGPDMDMGGCDGGMLTCFNCGQIGHFARNCKAGKGDSLLPLQDEEEECPYPTLEEAANMAKESVLAVRKPNQVRTKNDVDNIEDQEINEDENLNENHEGDENNLPRNATETNNELFDDDDDEDLRIETERLEQEIAKMNVQNYIDMTTHVKPYYNLQDEGRLIETPEEVLQTLRKFGHGAFRAGQEQAIMRILSGKSTLVTLSTGSGKSLCYQLPAYLYSQREPCITLIISPLVSLMEDQVTGIPAFLKAACLHTNQTKIQREKIMEAISTGSLHILLVSPEAVVAGEKSTGFGSLLRKLPPIAFACIDEAHCVSQWSHNFRPSYLKICRVLRERLGVSTVLGLTATATRATSDSIIRHLSIPDGRDGIITDIPLPDNLRLTVSRDGQRDQALLALLLSERFSQCRSIIVYCTRREECQRVATYLRTCLKDEGFVDTGSKKRKKFNVQAEPYHAGMAASRRRSIQKAFMSGELRIVVATVAFGMGINKSNIRAVIHYNMPMSFESYVQEVGRAGRDGLLAHCHLFLDSQRKDENELRRHIYANSTDRHVIRKLLQRCFVPCSCKTTCPRHETAFSIEETVRMLDIPEENIETLLCYLELHGKRYVELLSHAYVTCKIISYGGPNEIKKAAKDCPPLAMALALHHKNDATKQDNVFEFPVVEIASIIGWDSGICKHKLKNLEWITENNQPKRSKLSVQFLNLGFRLLAPGNLSDSELDEALDSLFERVKDQEHTALLQLHAVHTTLTSVASSTFHTCISDGEISENEKLLKFKIREYFESPKPLELLPEIQMKSVNEEQITSDVRSLVCMYRDNAFTGRAVARIFYGIQSPNYPAVMWGRCKYWRAHLGADFNSICQIATREILRMR